MCHPGIPLAQVPVGIHIEPVPPDDSKRIKMCRYCDGMIEWGTEVCPHCGKDLAVEKFDDLEFIPTDVSPGKNMPKGPPKIAQPVDPEPPPIAQVSAISISASRSRMRTLESSTR